ncbi:MAG: aminotransferase class IV [Bacteroidota bacterium]
MTYYNINGKIVPKSEAFVHVSDLSLHRGYSIFDYFCVREGMPLFIEDYLDRFEASAEMMLLKLPIDRVEIKKRIDNLIALNEVKEAGIKLMLTGGDSEDGFTPAAEANLYILVLPPITFPEEIVQHGMRLLLHEHTRYIPNIKMTNYVEVLRQRKQLQEKGMHDLLFHQNGVVSESSRSNFFIVTPQGQLVTSSDDILYGVTRKQLLKIAPNHYEVEIRNIKVEEVKDAQEAFICSSAKGTIGIVQVDDWKIGDGRVGAVTRRLNSLYEEKISKYLAMNLRNIHVP